MKDEVVGKVDITKRDAFLHKPFRRSPLWTGVRVILQLLLANTIDEATAILLYKLVVLRFLCTFLEESFVKQLDTDTAMQMIAKLARRLYKVDSLLQHNKSAQECLSLFARQSQKSVAAAVERTRALLDERWAAIIDKEREESQIKPPPTHQQFLADTKHDVTNIKNHISGLNTLSEIQIPQGEFQTESIYNFLDETESLRLEDLSKQNCEDIRERFEKYLREALKFYFSDDEARVVPGMSLMLLTLLKLIIAVDQKATHKFPLLKEHKLGIDAKVIHLLLLPLKNDMEFAVELEDHLIMRQSPTFPSLIGETNISEHSYSVRHAQQSEQMQKCKRTLSEMASKPEAERKEAVKRARQRYKAISEEISRLQCLNNDASQHSTSCTRCHKTKELDEIRVHLYDHTSRLPVDGHCPDANASALAFELLAPIEIVSLRDCLYLFNSRIFGFTDVPLARDLNFRCLRVLEFYKRRNFNLYLKTDLEKTYENKGHWMDFKNFVNISQQNTEIPNDTDNIGNDNNINNFNEVTESVQKFVRLGNNCTFTWERCLVAGRIDESLSEYCMFKVEQRHFGNTDLQWALSQTISQNVAYSKLNLCPDNMSLAEFREFGTFRAGHRLQLRNLYRALEQRTLSLKSRAVLALILQSLWQAGPPLPFSELSLVDRKWIRDAHVDLLCPHFCLKLIKLCSSVVELYSKDLTAHTALLAIEAVLSRIASLNFDKDNRSLAIKAQIRCLEIAYGWTEQLQNLLYNSYDVQTSEESKHLRLRLIEACCCVIFCFFHDSESIKLLISKKVKESSKTYKISFIY